jgi:hypothetical protein
MQPKYLDPQSSLFEFQIERVFQQVAHISLKARHGIMVSVAMEYPANMPPQQIDEGRVGVWLLIAVLMMHAMDRNPSRGTILKIAKTQYREGMFQPFWAVESTVREQSVVSDGDT